MEQKSYTFSTLWRTWELALMALTIWREARGESYTARVGVAHSVRNRVEKPKWWGKSYDEVLSKKWQYSSLTDPKDRQLTTYPRPDDAIFEECLTIAYGVMNGIIQNPVPGADSYYDDSIAPPKWAEQKMFVAKIGRLNFYNVDLDYEKIPPSTPV